MHENVEMPFNSSRLCRRLLYTSFRHYFLIHLFEEDTLMFSKVPENTVPVCDLNA